MALYDNKYWLLSHIRNSFITTDDTGMCEVVMAGESKDIKKHILAFETYREPEQSEDDDEDDLAPQSYDIETEFDFGGRERSNTAVQLDKFEVKKKSAKMKHVKWETDKNPVSQEYLDKLFVKRDINQIKVENKRSLVTEIIKQYTNLPENPFTEYAKFDGSGQVNIPTRKYRIFLTILPESKRNYPMNVCCISSAKIEDLIGLILLHVSTNYADITLKPINNYGLYITEENGEVDSDFPRLDPRECIAKFGFHCLGLVEHKDSKSVSFEDSHVIAIGTSHDDFRKKKTERDTRLEEKRKIQNMQLMDVHNKAMEAPLYQSYRVFKIINKVRAKVEIHLGISGEKIEIDPIQQKNSKFNLIKQKAISHHMDTIAWCEITDVRSNRTSFKIVYSLSFGGSSTNTLDTFGGNASSFPTVLQSSASFKQYEFEADNSTAIDIVQKINSILDLRSSASRKEYVAAKERKHYKRKSFNIGKK